MVLKKREFGKQGQVSMEYLIVMGFVFMMITPLMVIFLQQNDNLENSIAITTASKVSKQIIDASEDIYYKGEPSKTTLKLYFPKRIDAAQIASNEVIFNISGTKNSIQTITYPSDVNISGDLKEFSGVHIIEITSRGNYVFIEDK